MAWVNGNPHTRVVEYFCNFPKEHRASPHFVSKDHFYQEMCQGYSIQATGASQLSGSGDCSSSQKWWKVFFCELTVTKRNGISFSHISFISNFGECRVSLWAPKLSLWCNNRLRSNFVHYHICYMTSFVSSLEICLSAYLICDLLSN